MLVNDMVLMGELWLLMLVNGGTYGRVVGSNMTMAALKIITSTSYDVLTIYFVIILTFMVMGQWQW